MTRLILLLVLLCGCGVTEVVDRTVSGMPILIRAPQPCLDDICNEYEGYNIKTVINLRGYDPDEDWCAEEKKAVVLIGAKWIQFPVSGRRAPTPYEVEMLSNILEDRNNWPILVHCQGGVHRTGWVVAFYRIQYEGWKNSDAVAEMEDNGFDWSLHDRSEIKEWLLNYRIDPYRIIDQ